MKDVFCFLLCGASPWEVDPYSVTGSRIAPWGWGWELEALAGGRSGGLLLKLVGTLSLFPFSWFWCFVWFCFNNYLKKLFIWLCWVLVGIAQNLFSWSMGIFSCDMQTLSCSMWDLVPQLEIKPRTPALEVQSVSHWTTREILLWWVLMGNECDGDYKILRDSYKKAPQFYLC